MRSKLGLITLLLLFLASPVRAADVVNSNGVPRIPLKDGTSSNWAGYASATDLINPARNSVTDVQGSWIVPALSCTSANTYSSVWIGIDGYSDNTVEQIGTEQDCLSGRPTYYAWYEMYPKPSNRVSLPVAAGDQVKGEVSYVHGKFVLTLQNLTNNRSYTISLKGKARLESAEWIAEAPSSGGVLPLANFGTVTFANAQATINSIVGTISTWSFDPLTMVNSSNQPKATPSDLSADGSSFSVVWNSN